MVIRLLRLGTVAPRSQYWRLWVPVGSWISLGDGAFGRVCEDVVDGKRQLRLETELAEWKIAYGHGADVRGFAGGWSLIVPRAAAMDMDGRAEYVFLEFVSDIPLSRTQVEPHG